MSRRSFSNENLSGLKFTTLEGIRLNTMEKIDLTLTEAGPERVRT